MISLFRGNVKMALDSIRSARWRSLLTMLGIIIGVSSVVTTVSLGEGVKQQVNGQIKHLGPDLITIRPGKNINRDQNGQIVSVNLFNSLATNTLSEKDYQALKSTPGVRAAVPMSIITGVAETEGKNYDQGLVIATTDDLPDILNQKIQFGNFFKPEDATRKTAVIGKRVAEQLFGENAPIGRDLIIRGQQFSVKGVFDEFAGTPLIPGTDYNSTIFIPYEIGKSLSGGETQIFQILVLPKSGIVVDELLKDLNLSLLASHQGQNDYTILKQSDNLAIANSVLNIITALIAGVAGISLLVGGIGIMNIMLVSVTERTHEIGVRKAIGARQSQILGQFVIEAAVLSLLGGIIGLLVSIAANGVIRVMTHLQPVINFPIMIIATSVALVVGMVFGLAPALKAARQDPIDALRANR